MAISIPIRSSALALAFGLIFASLTGQCYGQLQIGFYNGKCGNVIVENVVRQTVWEFYQKDITVVAALLRLHFHDCFVNGCDASILLDVSNSEKTAPPNFSVRGYDIIDAIKSRLEAACSQVVSCADIIAMATRDAVSLSSGGSGPGLINPGPGWYQVETGRKDGTVSSAANVRLPSPSMTVTQALAAFKQKNLFPTDAVFLIGGGHSVGVAHCPLFQDRLYNFNGTGRPDPTINPVLLAELKTKCPQNSANNNINATLDHNAASSFILDKSFFQQIIFRNGILQIDQELAQDSSTANLVQIIANSPANIFYSRFAAAMVNLGKLSGPSQQQLEIRKSCRAVNSNINPFQSLLP